MDSTWIFKSSIMLIFKVTASAVSRVVSQPRGDDWSSQSERGCCGRKEEEEEEKSDTHTTLTVGAPFHTWLQLSGALWNGSLRTVTTGPASEESFPVSCFLKERDKLWPRRVVTPEILRFGKNSGTRRQSWWILTCDERHGHIQRSLR